MLLEGSVHEASETSWSDFRIQTECNRRILLLSSSGILLCFCSSVSRFFIGALGSSCCSTNPCMCEFGPIDHLWSCTRNIVFEPQSIDPSVCLFEQGAILVSKGASTEC